MARFYAATAANLNSPGKLTLVDAILARGNVKAITALVPLAAQAVNDDVVLGEVKAGDVFLGAILTTAVTLGSSTIALGIIGSTAKYRAAATFTAVDTPTLTGKASQIGVAEAAAATLLLTITGATMPTNATPLRVVMLFATPDGS
jgi:hypothetical protein